MKFLKISALILLLAPLTVIAAKLPENLRAYISAPVKVNAQGRVEAIGAISPELDADLAQIMRERIGAIEFAPGRLNGVAATVEATLTLELGLRESAAGLKLDLVDVTTGPRMSKVRKPQIPEDIRRRGENVTIVVRVEYDESGKVVDALVEHATVPIPRIEALALKAARVWEFEPERVDGKAIAGGGIVPIMILMQPPQVPDYTVNLKGGGKLTFQPKRADVLRERLTTALAARPESFGGELALDAAIGG